MIVSNTWMAKTVGRHLESLRTKDCLVAWEL